MLDEPTAGLDPKGRDEILEQIARLHRERNITVLLVSHSMEDVAKYVDRILVMDDGKIMFDDVPKRVFHHYQELEKIALEAKGWKIDTDATTVEEARSAVLRALGR